MNRQELNFVMDLLKITEINRRQGIASVIVDGNSARSVERLLLLPKNTLIQSVKRCKSKWNQCLSIHKFVEERRK